MIGGSEYSKKNIKYLHVVNDDGELSVCAVSCQQILTVASEGEELVVEGLEVRLAHHQTLTYTQTRQAMTTLENQQHNIFPTSRICHTRTQ